MRVKRGIGPPYWKGYLKLSLVSCPIMLFPATSERQKLSFHQQRASKLAASTLCQIGLARHRPGRSRRWLKVKNPIAPALKREAGEIGEK